MTYRLRGLTLIELMVTVAIIAILAAIAYPIYTQQTQKTRRTEGRGALMELAQAQERFYTVNGSYSTDPVALGVATAVDGSGRYTTEHGYYLVGTTGGATFTATATPQGAQSGDSDCTAMTITNTGVKGGSPTSNKCW